MPSKVFVLLITSNLLSTQPYNLNMNTLVYPSILDLNDDCLMAIFRLLPLPDLIAASDTSKRFQKISTFVFARNFKIIDLNAPDEHNHALTKHQTARLLQNFGFLISDLRFKQTPFLNEIETQKIFMMIVENCGGTLKSLTFHSIYVDLSLPAIQSLFGSLKSYSCRIDISEKRDFNGNIMDNEMEMLLESVNQSTSPNVAFLCLFSNLEKLDLSNQDLGIIFEVLGQNKALRKIKVNRCRVDDVAKFLEDIVINLMCLEKLTVNGSYDLRTFDCLTKMRNINSISLSCPFDDVSHFLNKMVSLDTLQCLRLTQVRCTNQLMATIAKFYNLRELEIDAFESSEQQIDLRPLGQLHGLRKLTLGGNLNTNQQDLVQLVIDLGGLKSLNFNFTHFSMDLETLKMFGCIANKDLIVTELGTKVRSYFTGRYVGLVIEKDGSGFD